MPGRWSALPVHPLDGATHDADAPDERNRSVSHVVVSPLQRRQPGPPATVEARCRAVPRIRSRAVLAVTALPVPVGRRGTRDRAPAPATPAARRLRRPRRLDTVDTYSGLRFTVPAGKNDLGQPQTCTIDADLYKPHSASRTARVPAILTTNGFGGSKADQAGLGEAFAKRGYAVLSYTGLGFPDSGCKISLDDPGVDGTAATSLVTFLGGGGSAAYTSSQVGGTAGGPGTLAVDFTVLDNPATHDPRLGMIGGYNGGQIQFATAAVDSRVDTLVPLITWNDLRYSLAPNNTSFTSGVTYANSSPGRGEDRLGGAVLRRRDPRRAPGCRDRPGPQRRLPQLRPGGLCGQGHPGPLGIPDQLDLPPHRPGLGQPLHRQGQGADVPHPGRERHLVQPAGGHRHLPLDEGSRGAGDDGVAVVGSLRWHRRELRRSPR